jgi:hypothetical protein
MPIKDSQIAKTPNIRPNTIVDRNMLFVEAVSGFPVAAGATVGIGVGATVGMGVGATDAAAPGHCLEVI